MNARFRKSVRNAALVVGTTVLPALAMAQATVPAPIQTAIDDSSALGKVIVIAVAAGLAVVGLLKRGFGKAGV